MRKMTRDQCYDYLCHYGVKGMKAGVNRWRNPDGTLTEEGKRHYGIGLGLKEKYSNPENRIGRKDYKESPYVLSNRGVLLGRPSISRSYNDARILATNGLSRKKIEESKYYKAVVEEMGDEYATDVASYAKQIRAESPGLWGLVLASTAVPALGAVAIGAAVGNDVADRMERNRIDDKYGLTNYDDRTRFNNYKDKKADKYNKQLQKREMKREEAMREKEIRLERRKERLGLK